MTGHAWRISFPDGSSIGGSTAASVLKIWRERQWHDATAATWRQELAKRAYVWSDSIVDPSASASDFLQQLADAGILRIDESPTHTEPRRI